MKPRGVSLVRDWRKKKKGWKHFHHISRKRLRRLLGACDVRMQAVRWREMFETGRIRAFVFPRELSAREVFELHLAAKKMRESYVNESR